MEERLRVAVSLWFVELGRCGGGTGSSGSGQITRPPGAGMPPASRMATMERARCWLAPIRPVTPFMITPSRMVSCAVRLAVVIDFT